MSNGNFNSKCVKIATITGIEGLITNKGLDIVDVITNLNDNLARISASISDLSIRVSSIESNGTKSRDVSGPALEDIKARFEKFENMLESDDLRGPRGLPGPAGPAGPKGKVELLQDIKDVDVSGLQDGCVLVRRGDKWKVEMLSDE